MQDSRLERGADDGRLYRVRRTLGPVTNVRRAIAVALIASLGWSLGCLAAPPLQKETKPTPPRRSLKPVEQQKTAPPNSRGTERRETTTAPIPASPAGAKIPAAPQMQAAPKQPAPAGAPNSSAPHDAEPTFPSLPAASRTRMRDCGHEWQEMKRTGQAKELTWRDFATRCLTR